MPEGSCDVREHLIVSHTRRVHIHSSLSASPSASTSPSHRAGTARSSCSSPRTTTSYTRPTGTSELPARARQSILWHVPSSVGAKELHLLCSHSIKLSAIMINTVADASGLPKNPNGSTYALSFGDTTGCGYVLLTIARMARTDSHARLRSMHADL